MPRTLAQNATYINETIKPAIKSAIEAQGVTVPSTDSFLDYADRIGEIEGGGSGYQLKDLPTGSIATVNDAEALPLNALKVSVEAWQEGTGDPSPSNIRPIHGWDSGEIGVVGKNWFNKDSADNLTGKALNASTGVTYNVSSWTVSELIKVKNGKTYTYSYDNESNIEAVVCFYDKNKTYIDGFTMRTTAKQTFTINDARIFYCRFDVKNDLLNSTQFELGNQATTYEPYQGKQYTLDFPQTIYGAEWDVVDGELGLKITDKYIKPTVTRVGVSGGVNYADCSVSGLVQNSVAISNMYSFISTTTTGVNGKFKTYTNELTIYDDRFTDTTTAQNVLNDAEFKVKLATPIYITLTGLSIRMLQGVNNIHANCGEILEGEYFVGSSGAYDLYDYIQTDGTQLIDTGRAITAGDVVNTIFTAISGGSNGAYVWGKYVDPYYTALVIYPNNGFYRHYDHATINDNPVDQINFTVGKITEDSYTVATTLGGNYTLFDTASVKLYAFSINGDDYLPCKRRSDGKFGLYDVANSTFLTDSASGNAITGGNNLGVRIG